MELLDSSVLTVGIPSISSSLGVDPVQMNLSITVYFLTAAVFIPLSAWVASRFGDLTTFCAAVGLFTAGSLLCGLANGIYELVTARILQGVGGAMMLPVGRTIVVRSMQPSELIRAMAILTTPAIFAPIIGPPLGGALITFGSWRLIFFLNVPLGIVAIIAAIFLIKDAGPAFQERPDLKGFVLLGSAFASLIFGFEDFSTHRLPLVADVSMVFLGGVLLLVYSAHAAAAERPILDLRLLFVKSFASSLIGGGICRIGLGAMPLLMAVLLQLGLGMDAFSAGLVTLASAVGALTNKPTIPFIVARLGARNAIILAALANGGSLILYATNQVHSSLIFLVAAFFVGGFFRSLLFTVLNAVSYRDIAEGEVGHASSLSSVAQQITISIGTGLAAVLLTIGENSNVPQQNSINSASVGFLFIGLLTLTSIPFLFAISKK